MSEIYKRQIIKFLKHRDYTPLKVAPLAKAIGVSQEDYPQFKLAFEELHRAGHVIIGTGNLVSLPPLSGQIIGTFRANPRGFGFVTPRESYLQGDLFIPPSETAEAMTGDIVAAQVVKCGKQAGQMRCSGRIVEIIERSQNRVVGTLVKRPEGWLLEPDGKGFVEPIGVDDVTAKNAREKDKVIVEILTWPTEKCLARGVIIEVLGRAGQYESEIRSVIHQYHLPGEFENDCIEQAREAAAGFNPGKVDSRLRGNDKREDITGKVVITIDPPDAKDFDDAISIEKDGKGNCELGVHIADVSSFVTADSPLDVEAKDRGNSAYLPGRTIPMLPEVLSNGICSLQPGQRRFCKSAYLTYDQQGNITGRRFANSIINSTQRLTYEDADKALKGQTKGIKPEVVRLLKDMEALSQAIEKRREKNGMIHLDLPEIELVMDKTGRVVDAHPAETSYPHTIIEMFMVEANDAVAAFLDRHNIPFMRRIHPEPNALGMKNLSQIVKVFGASMPKTPDRSDIQALLASVKGADCSFAVNLAVLRSFEKAQYSPLNIGHFALASTHYCHFTSPIRRYADLLVHRVLDFCLRNQIDTAQKNSAGLDLTEIGKHLTFTEQRSEGAEKELKTVLILQMLSKRLGDELDCVVTGLANLGVFVQSQKFGIEGLIVMADLGGDVWKYDQKAQSVTGIRTGSSIRLGKVIKVRIVSVNVPARQLSLVPVKPLAEAGAGNSSRRKRQAEAGRKDKRAGKSRKPNRR